MTNRGKKKEKNEYNCGLVSLIVSFFFFFFHTHINTSMCMHCRTSSQTGNSGRTNKQTNKRKGKKIEIINIKNN